MGKGKAVFYFNGHPFDDPHYYKGLKRIVPKKGKIMHRGKFIWLIDYVNTRVRPAIIKSIDGGKVTIVNEFGTEHELSKDSLFLNKSEAVQFLQNVVATQIGSAVATMTKIMDAAKSIPMDWTQEERDLQATLYNQIK